MIVFVPLCALFQFVVLPLGAGHHLLHSLTPGDQSHHFEYFLLWYSEQLVTMYFPMGGSVVHLDPRHGVGVLYMAFDLVVAGGGVTGFLSILPSSIIFE